MDSANQNMKDLITCILYDIVKNFIPIICVALSTALWANIITSLFTTPTYTSSSTLVIFAQGNSSGAAGNSNKANSSVSGFQSVLNTDILKKTIAEKLDMDSFEGTIRLTAVKDTNLVTLSVTSENPLTSFRELQAILKYHSIVSDKVLGSVVLNVFIQPNFPTRSNQGYSVNDVRKNGFLLGAGVTILVIAAYSYMKNTVHSKEEIAAKLEIQSLGVVHHESRYRNFKSWWKKKPKSMILTDNNAGFEYTETMRKLFTSFESENEEMKNKVILFTSYGKGEGKTTLVINTGIIASQRGQRVLLIEADTEQTEMASLLKMNTNIGYTAGHSIQDFRSVIQHVPNTHISILANTKEIKNKLNIFELDSFKHFVQEMRKEFDLILIDAPSAEEKADQISVLAALSDASVVVVRQNQERSADINKLIDDLSYYGNGVLGCVLNDKIHVPSLGRITGGYGYGYRYGYGYGYGANRYGYGRYGYGKYGRYAQNKEAEQ